MGLDETLYGPIKLAMQSQVPLPTLEEAYNALTQDEESKLLGRLNNERSDNVNFAVQTISCPRNFENKPRPNVTCVSCGKPGHVAENCYRRIGYPPWWGEKPSPNKTGNNFPKGNSGSGHGSVSNTAQVNHVLMTTTSSAPASELNEEYAHCRKQPHFFDLQGQQLVPLLKS